MYFESIESDQRPITVLKGECNQEECLIRYSSHKVIKHVLYTVHIYNLCTTKF